jgi:hypothetical protein
VIALERGLLLERVHDREPRGGPLGHGDRHGPVQLHDGRGHEARERGVEHGDPVPVGLLRRPRAGVAGGDGGLEPVGAEAAAERLGPLERRQSAADEQLIPAPPVLIQQKHGLSRGADAGAQAGRLDLHQGDQPVHFRLVRRELREDPAQSQGLLAERRPDPVLPGGGGVALVEDEIDHFQHRREPGRQLVSAGNLEGHPGVGEGTLGTHDSLGQRGLGHEERAGDLWCGEPAEQAESERHPRLGREHRMAGDEDETQEVVTDGIVQRGVEVRDRGLVLRLQLVAELPFLALVQRAAAQLVDRAVLGGRHEPRARLLGDPGFRPPLQRGDQGVLRQVLGQSDVAH